MENIDEWGLPVDEMGNPITNSKYKDSKYKVGDIIHHKKFGDCKVIEVDVPLDRYIVETQDKDIKHFALSVIDKLSKPSHQVTIVAGKYKKPDGSYYEKEYFFKDRINNGFGGLQIGDIGLGYSHKAKKCVPIKITRIGISSQELKENNVDRASMIYINYKGE